MAERKPPQRVRVTVSEHAFYGEYERIEDAATGQEITGVAALGLSAAAFMAGHDETCVARMQDGSLRRFDVVELVKIPAPPPAAARE